MCTTREKIEANADEAEFRERRLRDENQILKGWLGVIESHPEGIVPDRIAVENMKKMAKMALEEISSKKLECQIEEDRSDDEVSAAS